MTMRERQENFVLTNQHAASIARNFVIPSLFLFFYCGVYAALSVFVLRDKESVNHAFSLDLGFISLGVLLASALVYLAVWRGRATVEFTPSSRTLAPSTYFLISLLPLSPVIRYLIANRDIASVVDTILVLAIFFSLFIVFIVVIPYLLSRYASGRLLLSTANALLFTMLNMASISRLFSWHQQGDIVIQLCLFTVVWICTWFLAGLKRNDIAFVVVAFVVGATAIELLSLSEGQEQEATAEAVAEIQLMDSVLGREPAETPSIYLLVYDSYVPNETMLHYGIDNSDQERYLVEQGFELYPHTYSVGANSLASMNVVLNVSAEGYVSRVGVDGSGRAIELLRSLGYRTAGVFGTDYFFRGLAYEPQYDYYTPQFILPTYRLLSAAIWNGEFRFDLGLESIPHTDYVALKREVFANPSESPTFLYSHSIYPGHSQNSGSCLPNEVELFRERLQIANDEMRMDIATLLDHDPNAIIIIAGDHGPALTKNCTTLSGVYQPSEIDRVDIQDRFGSFLGVRWPSSDDNEHIQITVLQDIFPAVFAWMYRDTSLLEARISPVTITNFATAEVEVHGGIIVGGADDGEPLYLSDIN